MRWLRIRFDTGQLGARGSFPWQAWPSKAGRQVTIYDAHGDVLAVVTGGGETDGERIGRERAIAIGQLLEEVSWAAREDRALQEKRLRIASKVSAGGLWATTDEQGRRWWRRLRHLASRGFRSTPS